MLEQPINIRLNCQILGGLLNLIVIAFITTISGTNGLGAVKDVDDRVGALNKASPDDQHLIALDMIEQVKNGPEEKTVDLVWQKWAPALLHLKMPEDALQLVETTLSAIDVPEQPTAADATRFVNLWALRLEAMMRAGRGKEAAELLKGLKDKKIGHTLLASNGGVYKQLVASLRKSRLPNDAAQIALQGILILPDNPAIINDLAQQRAEALLEAGDFNAALQAAKSYYNIAPLSQTNNAVDLVSICLLNAEPNEKGIVRRLKAQQLADGTAGSTTQPASGPENILNAIKVNSADFDPAIQAIDESSFKNLVSRGNLLLFANKSTEAREAFEKALAMTLDNSDTGDDVVKTHRQMNIAQDGIARSIRAIEGNVHAANQYSLEHPQEKEK